MKKYFFLMVVLLNGLPIFHMFNKMLQILRSEIHGTLIKHQRRRYDETFIIIDFNISHSLYKLLQLNFLHTFFFCIFIDTFGSSRFNIYFNKSMLWRNIEFNECIWF